MGIYKPVTLSITSNMSGNNQGNNQGGNQGFPTNYGFGFHGGCGPSNSYINIPLPGPAPASTRLPECGMGLACPDRTNPVHCQQVKHTKHITLYGDYMG